MAYTPKQVELQDRLFKALEAFCAEWDIPVSDVVQVVGNVKTALAEQARKEARKRR